MRRRILVVGIMMLFLVGCSNESNAQAAHPDGKDETASVGHWDPNEWKPTVQITRPVLSGEEKDRLRREVARQHVSDPNLKEKLPDVPAVAYLDSFREYEKKHAQCVTDVDSVPRHWKAADFVWRLSAIARASLSNGGLHMPHEVSF